MFKSLHVFLLLFIYFYFIFYLVTVSCIIFISAHMSLSKHMYTRYRYITWDLNRKKERKTNKGMNYLI